MNNSKLKAFEELKRERNWNPDVRWKVIQNTISWAEVHTKRPRNSCRACIIKQAALLKSPII